MFFELDRLDIEKSRCDLSFSFRPSGYISYPRGETYLFIFGTLNSCPAPPVIWTFGRFEQRLTWSRWFLGKMTKKLLSLFRVNCLGFLGPFGHKRSPRKWIHEIYLKMEKFVNTSRFRVFFFVSHTFNEQLKVVILLYNNFVLFFLTNHRNFFKKHMLEFWFGPTRWLSKNVF